MDRNDLGQRDGGGNEWIWGREGQQGQRTGFRRLGPLWLALIATGTLALFLLLGPNGDAPAGVLLPIPTPAPVIATTPTAAPTAEPDIIETVTPVAGGPRFRTAVWADGPGRWQFGDLDAAASGYREGQAIPFLLRIDDMIWGDAYKISLRYDCGAGGGVAFDFLTGYERDAGSGPALAEEGPGLAIADATAPVPDDPAIGFDDTDREGERQFRLWGGSFDGALTGPAPETRCSEDKLVGLTVRAYAPTVYLLWGGHLGSSADWGEGQGAASQDSPFHMEFRVPGVAPESRRLEIDPGAVSP